MPGALSLVNTTNCPSGVCSILQGSEMVDARMPVKVVCRSQIGALHPLRLILRDFRLLAEEDFDWSFSMSGETLPPQDGQRESSETESEQTHPDSIQAHANRTEFWLRREINLFTCAFANPASRPEGLSPL